MTRTGKWVVGLGVALGLAGLLWVGVARQVPPDEVLASRAATGLEAALGVKVTVGSLHWRLLPVPALVLQDVATAQPQALVLKELVLYPNLLALWQRQLKLDRAELHGAVLPQLSLRALGATPGSVPGKGAGDSAGKPLENALAGFSLGDIPLARLVFRNVTWVSRSGIAVVYDGEVDFDAAWRPRQAQLQRPGFTPATDLTLTRQGQEDRWAVRVNVGGGTAHGEAQLHTRANGRLHLDGQLKPEGVEVASAMAAINRRPLLQGLASGQTRLSAHGDNAGELAQSLHTQTVFTLGRATLLRFDLDKAVRSAGQEHSGQTVLDAVSGQLDTQNTPQGMVLEFTGIKAASGVLSAQGQARIANRQVEAEFAVDLVQGVVGVPLRLSGPLDQVKVSVPAGAVAGALVGTAVLPGVGTAIGARIGATLGKMFSPDTDRQAPATRPGKAP